MYTHTKKSKENKSRAVANSTTRKKIDKGQSSGFADNRPETIIQRKIISIANNHPIIQRKIGDGGAENIGKFVQKKPSKVPWKIIAAVHKDAGWEYEIDFRGLAQKKVMGTDDDYEIMVPQVDPKAEKVKPYIVGSKKAPVEGDVKNWIADDEDDGAISKCIMMNEELKSNEQIKYLWSGGAADCIIVSAYNNGEAYMTHATRVSAGSVADIVKGFGGSVYLSSQYFGLDPESAADAGTVQEIVGELVDKKVAITAMYGTGRLAINSKTGAVLSKFINPK